MKENLKYRISEKNKKDSNVNIEILLQSVNNLYETKCIENITTYKNTIAKLDNNSDAITKSDSNINVNTKNKNLKDKDKDKDKDILLDIISQSEILATSLHYETNINLDKLKQIANYYNISHRKKKKVDLAKDLAIFEHDTDNIEIVNKRKKLWENIKELKKDDFFKQYILFNI